MNNIVTKIVVFLGVIFLLLCGIYYFYYRDVIYQEKTTVILNKLKYKLYNVRRHCNRYPLTEEGITTILDPVKKIGPICKDISPLNVSEVVIHDYYGKQFIYISDGKTFKIKTSGDIEIEVTHDNSDF